MYFFPGTSQTLQQMDFIRQQQEKLARQHFETYGPHHKGHKEDSDPFSAESLQMSRANMNSLMAGLEQLSVSIEKLHSGGSNITAGNS